MCSTLTKGTFSNRLLLSNQVKGCSPSVAYSLPLPLGPALLNLSIIYCACVWAPHQRNHLDRLEKMQRKITRTLFFKQFPNADATLFQQAYWFRYSQDWGCSQNSKADSGFQDFEWFGPLLLLVLTFSIADWWILGFCTKLQGLLLSSIQCLFHSHVFGMKYHLICMLSIICLVLK